MVELSFVNWLLGALALLITIILGIPKIIELFKKKFDLEIKLKQKNFSFQKLKNYDEETKITFLEIEADINNKAHPTTISKVLLDLEINGEWIIKGFSMERYNITTNENFVPIRLDKNTRLPVALRAKIYDLDSSNKKVKAKLIFETAHGDLEKEIELKEVKII